VSLLISSPRATPSSDAGKSCRDLSARRRGESVTLTRAIRHAQGAVEARRRVGPPFAGVIRVTRVPCEHVDCHAPLAIFDLLTATCRSARLGGSRRSIARSRALSTPQHSRRRRYGDGPLAVFAGGRAGLDTANGRRRVPRIRLFLDFAVEVFENLARTRTRAAVDSDDQVGSNDRAAAPRRASDATPEPSAALLSRPACGQYLRGAAPPL